ncbi:MAG: hypothetical protein WEB05_05465 [Solirubrobacterales bacterium]
MFRASGSGFGLRVAAASVLSLDILLPLAAAPAALAATSPANTSAPTVSGSAQVDETLTAAPGIWTAQPAVDPADGYSYQW